VQDIISEGELSRFFSGMKPDKAENEEVLCTILFQICTD
jgi:hypothetical protein